MTRKDYILIAAALNDAFTSLESAVSNDYRSGVRMSAEYVAAALSRDNPRFDRDRFLKTCGVQS